MVSRAARERVAGMVLRVLVSFAVEWRWVGAAEGPSFRPAQERTRTLLDECELLVEEEEPGASLPDIDIDVTAALICTLPQAITAASAQARKTLKRKPQTFSHSAGVPDEEPRTEAL
jgi:hypothetical protein